MSKRHLTAAPAAVIAAAALLVACGDDEDDQPSGNSTDLAFAEAMVPHHDMAVEMAEPAQRDAEHPEIRRLAGQVIETQTAEIETLREINGELEADGVEEGDLGVAGHMTGMHGGIRMLEEARQFDRAFIAMMVPHHEGAIRMARVELAEGEDPRLRQLADGIIEAQQREIDQMLAWSERWYGEAPATQRHGGHMGAPEMDHMLHGEGM